VVHKNNLVVRFIKRDGEMKWRKWWRERVGRRKGGENRRKPKEKGDQLGWASPARQLGYG
jgi:hypothetical protein